MEFSFFSQKQFSSYSKTRNAHLISKFGSASKIGPRVGICWGTFWARPIFSDRVYAPPPHPYPHPYTRIFDNTRFALYLVVEPVRIFPFHASSMSDQFDRASESVIATVSPAKQQLSADREQCAYSVGQCRGVSEPFGEQHRFRDEFNVRHHHGRRPEHRHEVVGYVRISIAIRSRRDKYTAGRCQRDTIVFDQHTFRVGRQSRKY